MAKICHEDTFIKDYKGYSIYKNSKYSQWLDNGKYLLTRGSMLRAFDSIKACERWVNKYSPSPTFNLIVKPDLMVNKLDRAFPPLTKEQILKSLTNGLPDESD